ncbi:MAG: hypothetical protein MZV64_36010 [Ignavibacteriales bacterium]|nr:hypothetical protein [Ignavibacteriales bacterium]
MTKLFFATDVHGSDICWNKFINSGKFYGADISILGGDISGKAIVPIVNLGYGKHKVVLLQQESILEDESQLANMEKMIRSRGYYPYRTTHDELDSLNNDHDALENLYEAGITQDGTMDRYCRQETSRFEFSNLYILRE